jgi:hypothetical protein
MDMIDRNNQLLAIIDTERVEMEIMRKAKMRLQTENSALRDALTAIELICVEHGPFSGGKVADFLKSFRGAEQCGGIQIEGVAERL